MLFSLLFFPTSYFITRSHTHMFIKSVCRCGDSVGYLSVIKMACSKTFTTALYYDWVAL